MRENAEDSHPPGWDAKAISRIAKKQFGGFQEMFECHGWPERGSAMMPHVQTRIVEDYGTIQNFVDRYT